MDDSLVFWGIYKVYQLVPRVGALCVGDRTAEWFIAMHCNSSLCVLTLFSLLLCVAGGSNLPLCEYETRQYGDGLALIWFPKHLTLAYENRWMF